MEKPATSVGVADTSAVFAPHKAQYKHSKNYLYTQDHLKALILV